MSKQQREYMLREQLKTINKVNPSLYLNFFISIKF